MTAQHKSNIGCAYFSAVVVDLLLCKIDVNNHSLSNVGTASKIVN